MSNITSKVPAHLKKAGADLYREVDAAYVLGPVERAHLLQACEALDRMREAQAVLKKQGLVIRDRNGIPRPSPCTIIERNSRTAMLSALRALNIEPPMEKSDD